MPTIVRAGSSAEFLALVPHLLEYTPRSSLAVVTFAAGRSVGALRVDLPDPRHVAGVDSVASTVVGMACKVSHTDAIAAVVYTDARLTDAEALPHRALVDALTSRAEICGLDVTHTLVVGEDGWADYLAPTPAGPQPLTEIATPAQLPPMPSIDGDQSAAAALPAIGPAVGKAVARLLSDTEHLLSRSPAGRRLSIRRRTAAAALLDDLSDPPAVFEAAIASESPLDAPRLAAVAFCLQRPGLRDVALLQWVGDLATGDAIYRAQCAFADGDSFPEDLARPMWGESAKPESARLHRALAACRQVAAATPLVERAGPLAACAWLAWATGRSTHAAAYADQAHAIDPDHGLADIVTILVAQARLPEWVFEREPVTSPAGTGSSRGCRDQ
jgi:hypothetical protein